MSQSHSKENNIEQQILNEIRDSLRLAIKERLVSAYGSPLHKVIDAVIADNATEIKSIITDVVTGIVRDEEFVQSMREGLRHKIARDLVSSFGESLFKKELDKFKQDPALRARITLKIEELLK